MNSQPGGFFTAALMLVPLVGVPAAAIVGIPELPGTTPVHADDLAIVDELDAIESPRSAQLVSNSSEWNDLDDLLSPVPSAPAVTHQRAAVAPPAQAPDVTDPFGSSEPLYSPFAEMTSANEFTDVGHSGHSDSMSMNAPVQPDGMSLTSFSDSSNSQPVEPAWSDDAQQAPQANRIPQTWEQAVRDLNRLGVRTYRLEEDSRRGGYHFFCVFSPQDQPNVRHRFDGTAAKPLDAVVSVLTQIELWRNAR